MTGERADEYEEFLGYHLEQAYRYRVELIGVDDEALGLADRARLRLASAGRLAFRRGDTQAAINLLERARSLPATDERAWLELAPDLGVALFQAGELEQAESELSDAIERSSAAGARLAERNIRLVRDMLRMWSQPERIDPAALLLDTEQSLGLFQDAGDHLCSPAGSPSCSSSIRPAGK